METDLWIQTLLALVLVVGLIGLVAVLARKFMPGNLVARHHKDKRVSIEEITYIDPKHRLILIKRDDIRHLLLVGANHSVVIEHQIDNQPAKKTKGA